MGFTAAAVGTVGGLLGIQRGLEGGKTQDQRDAEAQLNLQREQFAAQKAQQELVNARIAEYLGKFQGIEADPTGLTEAEQAAYVGGGKESINKQLASTLQNLREKYSQYGQAGSPSALAAEAGLGEAAITSGATLGSSAILQDIAMKRQSKQSAQEAQLRLLGLPGGQAPDVSGVIGGIGGVSEAGRTAAGQSGYELATGVDAITKWLEGLNKKKQPKTTVPGIDTTLPETSNPFGWMNMGGK